MESAIKDVLDRFNASSGPLGFDMPEKDREALSEYLITKLTDTGVPVGEAYKIVRAFHWGSWSEGWNLGYDSAKAHYTQGK